VQNRVSDLLYPKTTTSYNYNRIYVDKRNLGRYYEFFNMNRMNF